MGLRSLQFQFRYTTLTRGIFAEELLGDLPPITVHHVWFVEFNFEKERPSCVRVVLASRGFGDLSTDDEAFDSFTFPFPCLGDLRCEIPDLFDRLECNGLGLDEAPVVSELVDNVSGLCAEICRVLVDTMEMESCLLRRVWKDVFLEVVVA